MPRNPSAEDIVRPLAGRGYEPEVRDTPGGGVWILCDYAVVTQIANDSRWHWATIASASTASAFGSFDTHAGLRRLLDRMPPRSSADVPS